jgi:outer membrane protein OmpA-like peptidoglycan-associated protein
LRHSTLVSAFALALVLIGCTAHQQSDTSASPSPAAVTTTSPAVAATDIPSAGPTAVAVTTATPPSGPTPVSTPTPTPNPNLLDVANGTILRSYSPATIDDENDGNLGNYAANPSDELPATATPPYTFVFEFPGVATITAFTATMANPPDSGGPGPSVTIAVSTTGANAGFNDVGTMTSDKTSTSKTLTANVKARWVRVIANGHLYYRIGATGTIAPPSTPVNPVGTYIEEARPEKNGAFVMSGTNQNDERVRFVAVGSGLTATECNGSDLRATFIGEFQGRNWNAVSAGNKDANPDFALTSINDEGTIIAGARFGGPIVFMRTSVIPTFCAPRVNGTGLHHVLVLDQDPPNPWYPADSTPPLAGYQFSAIGAGMLDANALAGQEAVVTRGVCNLPQLLSQEQIALLNGWVAAGHKLIIASGGCNEKSDFNWVPYSLVAPGPGPESTNSSLIQVESDALGSNDRNDTAHFVDVLSYVANANNALSNADPITTTDPHWCGHFFVAKTTNLNGFVQSYAVDGKGLLIYDGFNPSDNGQPPLQRIRQLELALPVPAELSCSQLVTDPFILEPSQEAAFSAGKAQKVGVPMSVLANQGWNGHVTVKATGDIPTTVSPAAFDIAGGKQPLAVSVNVPASQKPGVYTVTVTADNGSGKKAQATVSLTGTAAPAAIKKQFKTEKRIRIYGIHFDVDSAHIQPRSEPVIADIAQTMRETPGLRFQVEGHTDSDGGAAYNLGLSQRRAQAVVDDLVTRYKIARSRLVAKGYGLTRPVAPNTTPAGKALNRRVELLRL